MFAGSLKSWQSYGIIFMKLYQ